MKKQNSKSLALHKRAISILDNNIIGGRRKNSDSCPTQDPQTPTAISACIGTCPSHELTRECN